MEIETFSKICIETHSACNRKCATCLRQNDPTKSRHGKNVKLPSETVYKILDQAHQLGFEGPISLHHFNEPLMDPRIPSFAKYAKTKGLYIYLITNGDLLTPTLAAELDGVLNHIGISLYESSRKKSYFKALFNKTKIQLWGKHITTHFSPHNDTQKLIEEFRPTICSNPQNRLIITHTGDMALCCEDIALNWNLGNIDDYTLEELWFSPRHQKIVEILSEPGGRHAYHYCSICPREGLFE